MTWASSLTMTGSCPECCGCIGCVGQTTSPDYYNVTITITNPGVWDVAGFDWGCSGSGGSELTWDGIMPNDGNCVFDISPYCPFPLSAPPYVFDYSWFNGKTFKAYTRGVDIFGTPFDYAGCRYVLLARCSQDYMGWTYYTQLSLTIFIPSPGSVTYDLTIGGFYNDPSAYTTISRSSTGTSLGWGCSGGSFTSASGTFNFNSPGPSGMTYGTSGPGGTVAGSFIVTP